MAMALEETIFFSISTGEHDGRRAALDIHSEQIALVAPYGPDDHNENDMELIVHTSPGPLPVPCNLRLHMVHRQSGKRTFLPSLR